MSKIKKYKSGKFLIDKMQNLYCSCKSEFSSFLLFNYQSLIIKNKELSCTFKSFALSHLNNSQELAKIIISLKGLPFYINSQSAPLSAFWIQPSTNIKEIISYDKNFLTTLVGNYDLAINMCCKEEINLILLNLKSKSEDELDFLNKLNH